MNKVFADIELEYWFDCRIRILRLIDYNPTFGLLNS